MNHYNFRTSCICIVLIMLILGGVPTKGYTSDKFAVIAISPSLNDWEFNLNSPRIAYEINWYKNNGYKIASIKGTIDNIAEVLLHPDVKALTFVGYGGAVSEAGDPISSLAQLNAENWRRKIQWALAEGYRQRGMTYDEADARANKESEDFGLERMVNYSCWSLIDTSIAELFVQPGGLYYGSSVKYTSNPLSFLYSIWGNAQFHLEQYRVPYRVDPQDRWRCTMRGAECYCEDMATGRTCFEGRAVDLAGGINTPCAKTPGCIRQRCEAKTATAATRCGKATRW